MRGVDVSVFNENVDWQALKAAGPPSRMNKGQLEYCKNYI